MSEKYTCMDCARKDEECPHSPPELQFGDVEIPDDEFEIVEFIDEPSGELQEIPKPTKPENINNGVTDKRPRRRKNTAWDRATPRQQQFISEVLSGKTLGEAAQAVGIYREDDKKAALRGTKLIEQPKVYMALQERLNYMYPDLSKKVAQKLKFLLDQPVKTDKDMPGLTVREFLDVAKYLKEVQGWDAPKKSAHIRANLEGFAFPGEKKKSDE